MSTKTISLSELKQAVEQQENKHKGRNAPQSSLSGAKNTVEKTVATLSALRNDGHSPLDLNLYQRFLQLDALFAEAEAFHKLFPGECIAWKPPKAFDRFLDLSQPGIEVRILRERLWQGNSAFLTIEFEETRADDKARHGAEYLTMFFDCNS
jgi:hypothetical protein